MKRVFILSCFLLLCIVTSKYVTKGYVNTGHDEFSEIIFYQDGDMLLVDRDKSSIKDAYNSLKGSKIFGWETYYFNINSKAKYVGDTIFSKSNRTKNLFVVNYRLNQESFVEKSVHINGSVSSKIAGEIKKIDLSVSPKIDIWYEKNNTFTKEEETKFQLDILPMTKVSLRISGDAYVTSGVSKYYFLGITLRKGEWERIEVETMYYELVEEELSWRRVG